MAVDHDFQLRQLLRQHLGSRVCDGDLLVEEFTLAYRAVRADLALVNGHLEGFEIKAGRDTLSRLPAQVEAYDKVFEYSWVVTTAGHVASAKDIVPKTWGVLLAEMANGELGLRVLRKPRRSAKRDPSHLVRLLWREEVLGKLEELGLSRGLKSKPKLVLYSALAQALPVDQLADYVRTCLKARQDWRAGEALRVGDGSSRLGATL